MRKMKYDKAIATGWVKCGVVTMPSGASPIFMNIMAYGECGGEKRHSM